MMAIGYARKKLVPKNEYPCSLSETSSVVLSITRSKETIFLIFFFYNFFFYCFRSKLYFSLSIRPTFSGRERIGRYVHLTRDLSNGPVRPVDRYFFYPKTDDVFLRGGDYLNFSLLPWVAPAFILLLASCLLLQEEYTQLRHMMRHLLLRLLRNWKGRRARGEQKRRGVLTREKFSDFHQ